MGFLGRAWKMSPLAAAILSVMACTTDHDEAAGREAPVERPSAAATGVGTERGGEASSSAPSIELERAPSAPSTPAAPSGSVAAPSGPPPGGPSPAAREVGGLRITPGADGTIRIEGLDRWGGDATTTYESVEYLERALPVLERSLTPEQVAALRALVAELRAR